MGKPKQQPSHTKNLKDVKGLTPARIVASHGRHFLAQADDGDLWQVFGKGKRREAAVGDEVLIQPSGDKQAWIEEILPRHNLLYRSDEIRSKLFASNLDLVMLVVSIEPPFSEELLGRTWVACRHAGVPLQLVFNKTDLIADHNEVLEDVASLFADWGFSVDDIAWVSANEDPDGCLATIRPLVADKKVLILGQSGMGKSTLINLLIPEARAATNEISHALNAGKHTTTFTQIHASEDGFELIDSPGFQSFGLHHLSEKDLLGVFTDIADAAMRCRFANCKHREEPQCAVRLALDEGILSAGQYSLYLDLMRDIEQTKPRNWS